MRDIIRQVYHFQVTAGEPLPAHPTIPPDWQRRLKADLILEECLETMHAMGFAVEATDTGEIRLRDLGPEAVDIAMVADGLADSSYVQAGAANAWGLPLVQVWDEVHAANMRKFPGGKCIRREDGKILKPEGWKPADVAGIIEEAKARFIDKTKSFRSCSSCGNMRKDDSYCVTPDCKFAVKPKEQSPAP